MSTSVSNSSERTDLTRIQGAPLSVPLGSRMDLFWTLFGVTLLGAFMAYVALGNG